MEQNDPRRFHVDKPQDVKSELRCASCLSARSNAPGVKPSCEGDQAVLAATSPPPTGHKQARQQARPEKRPTALPPPPYSVPLRTASRSTRAGGLNPQYCGKPYDCDMSMQRKNRTPALSRRIDTPMIDATLCEARQRTGLPNHLAYVGTNLDAASTPPPGGFLPTVPPFSRPGMRRARIKGGISSTSELVHIHLQGNNPNEGAAPAMFRTRKRDEDKENVLCDERESTEVNYIHELVAKLEKDLRAASKRVMLKTGMISKLCNNLTKENEAADTAWSQASALKEAAKKSDLALEQASAAAAIGSTRNDDVFTRGPITDTMRHMEKDARKARNSFAEAKRVARGCDHEVRLSKSLLHRTQKALASAEQVRMTIEGTVSRTRVRVSAFNNEQGERKAKRARR